MADDNLHGNEPRRTKSGGVRGGGRGPPGSAKVAPKGTQGAGNNVSPTNHGHNVWPTNHGPNVWPTNDGPNVWPTNYRHNVSPTKLGSISDTIRDKPRAGTRFRLKPGGPQGPKARFLDLRPRLISNCITYSAMIRRPDVVAMVRRPYVGPIVCRPDVVAMVRRPDVVACTLSAFGCHFRQNRVAALGFSLTVSHIEPCFVGQTLW